MTTTEQEQEFQEATVEEQQTNQRFKKTSTQSEEELKKSTGANPREHYQHYVSIKHHLHKRKRK